MDQADTHVTAGLGERCHGKVVHATIGLATTLAQNADAVQHDVDILDHVAPVCWRGQAFESCLSMSAAFGKVGHATFDALRVPAADHDAAAAFQQRGNRVAPDESAASRGDCPALLRWVVAARCRGD